MAYPKRPVSGHDPILATFNAFYGDCLVRRFRHMYNYLTCVQFQALVAMSSRSRRGKSRARARSSGGATPPQRPRRILRPAVLLGGLIALALGVSVYWAQVVPEPPLLVDLEGLEPAFADRVRAQVQVVRDNPQNPDAHGALGILYQAHGYPDSARRCYENAIGVDSSRPRWRHHWAALAAAQGDRKGAETAFRKVIAQAPDYAPAYERLGLLLIDRNAPGEAADLFHTVIRLRPDDAQGYIGVGKVELALAQPESAVKWLTKAVTVEPANTEAHYLLGSAYRRLGRREEAEVELARGRGVEVVHLSDPWLADIVRARATYTGRFELAADLIDRGRTAEAAGLLEALLERQPHSVDVMNNLAVAYLRLGRLDDAEGVLSRALGAKGSHFAIHNTMARVLLAKGEPSAALPHAEEAARLAPTKGRAVFTKGVVLARSGRYEEALDTFRRVAGLDPRDPDVHVNIGRLLGHFERWDESAEAYRHAVAYRPQCVETRYDLGIAYSRAGRFEEAFDTFRATLELDPNNERVQGMLQWTQARLKRAGR